MKKFAKKDRPQMKKEINNGRFSRKYIRLYKIRLY